MISKMRGSKNIRGLLTFLSVAATLLALTAISACSNEASGKPKAEDPRKNIAVPVTVGNAVEKAAPVQLQAIGNVQPFATVSVKSQVEGELMDVHFKEGQEVKAGDLLFTIDSRVYEAQLKQAQANLAKNKAQLANARRQVERYGSVVKKGYVAEEQYDQVVSEAAALEASVKADEAAIENAKLKVAFCTIRSPISGVVGSLKVHKGNIIKANDNDNPLVTINQISPTYVAFSVPERNLPSIQKYMAERKLGVLAVIPGDEEAPVAGELAFIENSVDVNTGSIQLRARFANANRALWPGQFVNVALTLATQSGAVVIPSQAVQTGQQGQYVFVVKEDLTVELRPVTAGRTIGDEIIIAKGVSPGERVVTDGQLRLTSGATVKIVEAGGQKK
jgi:multidrug efflux system membrane fusion protein